MALLASEIARIKYELGFNLLTVGATPFIDVVAIFEQVIQPYLGAGAATTSSTAVTAADTPTPVTLTLASASGIATGCRLVIDVDDRQEIATLQNLSGSNATVLLSKTHTGTYPVTVEGGETIVRELLKNIAAVKSELASTFGYGALKKVDEIEFYQSGSSTLFGKLGEQLAFWRGELAAALGLQGMWSRRSGCGGAIAMY